MRKITRQAVLWYSVRNRQRKADAIVQFMREREVRSLLLCGAVPIADGNGRNEGLVERAIAGQAKEVLGFDVQPRGAQPWPFMVADGRAMPFDDQSYDLVVANAVIEHVGSESDQRRFVAEHDRVGKSWIITTPNRWFPVESHTSAFLAHWLPSWRARRTEFTRLLSRREFRAMLPAETAIHGRPWSPTFTAIRVRP